MTIKAGDTSRLKDYQSVKGSQEEGGKNWFCVKILLK